MNVSKLNLIFLVLAGSFLGCSIAAAQQLPAAASSSIDVPLAGPLPPGLIESEDANRVPEAPSPGEYEELPAPALEPCVPTRPLPNLGRPRIGVVLGGGGAAGVCHVGVLQVLEEYGIPVDCIAGTSMGSIVAGLYSMGLSSHEIERIVYQFRWDQVLVEPPSHATKYERRKTDDYLFPPAATLGIDHGKASLGGGFVSGQNLTLQLRRMLAAANPISNFDDLPIPFRTVATDLETGEMVVFRGGNLATAIRSSMSIPGVFPPVRYGKRLLIDGGVRNNVPVDLAREMGADILIVVRIPADFKRGDDLNSLFAISSQALTIMSAHGTSHQANGLTDLDILIEPPMDGIGSLDFGRAREAVALGIAATRRCDPQLRQLLELIGKGSSAGSVPQDGLPTTPLSSDAHHLDESSPSIMGDDSASETLIPMDPPQRIALASPGAFQVDRIRIWNRSELAPFESIASRLTVKPLKPFSLDQLERDIARIYGTGNFGNVDYELGSSESGESVLDIFASPDPRGRTLLTFGLGLEENFKGDSFYTASTSVVSRGLNELGGELRFVGQLGSRPTLQADFFQPLEPTQRYFIRPYLSYNGFVQPLVIAETKAAEYLFRNYSTGIELGRTLGDYGVVTAGTMLETSNGRLITGMPSLAIPNDFSSMGGFFCGIKHDSLDNYFFPKHGLLAETKYSMYENWFGDDSPADILKSRVIAAKSKGAHVGILRAEATIDEIFSGSTLLSESTSGGFLRMSGYSRYEIVSARHAITSLVYMHQFKSMMGNRFKAYHGFSAEVGYFGGVTLNIKKHKPIAAGSAFIALETPLGPMFAGYGISDSGPSSPFVAMGQVF